MEAEFKTLAPNESKLRSRKDDVTSKMNEQEDIRMIPQAEVVEETKRYIMRSNGRRQKNSQNQSNLQQQPPHYINQRPETISKLEILRPSG